MRLFRTDLVRALGALTLSALAVSTVLAQVRPDAFMFTRFSVPNAVTLGVESINNSGAISGYYTDSTGDYQGFVRTPAGAITTVVDPGATGSPFVTELGQINGNGIVAGYFYDLAASEYSGLFYSVSTEKFTTYNVPGQAANTWTVIEGINSQSNHFCGGVEPPPYNSESAFVNFAGALDIFAVESASTSLCEALNNSDTAVGFYTDAQGVTHGWQRTAAGTITTIDVPGAATALGTIPCGGMAAGTVVVGINNSGAMSGHYWDTSYNEHGFILKGGTFYTVNVPGAYVTSGGGINDHDALVGHWSDSSCNEYGYIATPSSGSSLME
jgi:hypothetical protein